MKTGLFIFLVVISSISFAQNEHVLKTEDGREVLLKTDFTWEYIDAETSELDISVTNNPKSKESTSCNLTKDFVEPKLDNKIQNQLKKGRATINHIKRKVAKDYNCTVEEVLLLSISEQKAKGVYEFCANGKRVTYKRLGNSIMEKGKFF